jgi:hypothetical protein
MLNWTSAKKNISDNKWAYGIGFGIAITPIHNAWLTDLLTLPNGQATVFLPQIGTVIWVMASMYYILNHWKKGDRWQDWLGDWRVFVPLLIVVLFMGISGFVPERHDGISIAPLFMGLAMFATYVVGRKLGVSLFRALIPFVVVGAVIAIILGILNPGVPASMTNGLITNYCACAGFLIFGGVVNQGKWQWVLLTVMLVGVFFIGALEAVFIIGVLGVAVIIRRDFSKPFLIVASVLVLLASIWLSLGHLTALYTGNHNIESLGNITLGKVPVDTTSLRVLTSGRWEPIVNALKDIKFFGHGYTLSLEHGGIVHNIPLIVVHQVGWVGGLAWLFVMVWCLFKTKWKYAWIMVLAMGVFDHYLFTQFPPYIPILIGVSTTSTIKSDLIFRKVKQEC